MGYTRTFYCPDSTYLGGGNDDEGYGIALDTAGNAYVTGRTKSSNFPTTAGAFDTSHNGLYDAFVAKLNIDGSQLLYSTYLGGSNDDSGTGITLDAAGDAHVTGWTLSSGFPTTAGAFDTSYNGDYDAFVTKLNVDGSNLLYSTFLGGSYADYGEGITLAAGNRAVVTGETWSSNFPTTTDAFDLTYNGTGDAFVAKLSSDGVALRYSTFLGGSDTDESHGITLDAFDNVYVTGYTKSTDFPTTAGAYDISFNGNTDAFVSVLSLPPSDPSGTGVQP